MKYFLAFAYLIASSPANALTIEEYVSISLESRYCGGDPRSLPSRDFRECLKENMNSANGIKQQIAIIQAESGECQSHRDSRAATAAQLQGEKQAAQDSSELARMEVNSLERAPSREELFPGFALRDLSAYKKENGTEPAAVITQAGLAQLRLAAARWDQSHGQLSTEIQALGAQISALEAELSEFFAKNSSLENELGLKRYEMERGCASKFCGGSISNWH